MQLQSNSHKIALRGMLVATAMILSWLESLLPTFVAIPGIKIGLTNIVVLIALYKLSYKDAFIINIIRIILVGITFGNAFSLLYSLAGGLLSGTIMIILKKTGRFGITNVSMAGGLCHNIGQILMAMLILRTSAILYYLPVLWFSGLFAGIIIGYLSSLILTKIRLFRNEQNT